MDAIAQLSSEEKKKKLGENRNKEPLQEERKGREGGIERGEE